MPDPRAAVARVVLVGVSCVGKTTVGRRVADVLACPFIDFDEAIDAHYGCALGRIKGGFLTPASFRRAAAPIIASRLAGFADQGFVLALPPSGLHAPSLPHAPQRRRGRHLGRPAGGERPPAGERPSAAAAAAVGAAAVG